MQSRAEKFRDLTPEQAREKIDNSARDARQALAFYMVPEDRNPVLTDVREASVRLAESGDVLAEAITDLLADLQHLAEEEDLDWYQVMDRAEVHFTAENAALEDDDEDQEPES